MSAIDTTTTFPAQTTSAGQARRFVARRLVALGQHESVDVAVLLTSELVTNALLHANSEIAVRVRRTRRAVRVEVHDRSPSPVSVRDYGAEASTGRGLLLVRELADSWGSEQQGQDGKTVWFELKAREQRDRARGNARAGTRGAGAHGVFALLLFDHLVGVAGE